VPDKAPIAQSRSAQRQQTFNRAEQHKPAGRHIWFCGRPIMIELSHSVQVQLKVSTRKHRYLSRTQLTDFAVQRGGLTTTAEKFVSPMLFTIRFRGLWEGVSRMGTLLTRRIKFNTACAPSAADALSD
jgi:hypothetical protein